MFRIAVICCELLLAGDYRDFSIIAVLAAVDSLDRKISKDLSGLDKTIYLMKFSFGPSEIQKWKREQFPNIKYDEYTYMKGHDEYWIN
jgi:putative ABC transport system permease protein